jgi:hypothetical protein
VFSGAYNDTHAYTNSQSGFFTSSLTHKKHGRGFGHSKYSKATLSKKGTKTLKSGRFSGAWTTSENDRID